MRCFRRWWSGFVGVGEGEGWRGLGGAWCWIVGWVGVGVGSRG